MSNINVTIRLEKELKEEAEALFANLGMNLNTAVNIFVRQAVREGRIPFEVSTRPSHLHSPIVIPSYYRSRQAPSYEYAVVELPEIEP